LRRRRVLQLLAALSLNPYVPYLWDRAIYQGGAKHLCAPGLNCYACPLAVFSCPIGGLQLAFSRFSAKMRDLGAGLGVLLYVAGSVGLMGCLTGRMLCGWLCPFGFLQDLAYKVPLPKMEPPKCLRLGRYLSLLILVALLPALTGVSWFSRLCPAGTLEGGLPLKAVPPSSPLPPTGWFFWLKLAILFLFLAWMCVSRRPFCRFACPLGAILGLFNRVSLYRMEVDEDSCTDCGACRRACPVDIDIRDDPGSPDCIRCLECKAACPRGAIFSGFHRPA
jgi:ferredoxin-type protein NapH